MPSPPSGAMFLAIAIWALFIGVCVGIPLGIWGYRKWFDTKDDPLSYERWRQVADDRGRLVPKLPAYNLILGVKLEEVFRDLDLDREGGRNW
jgi:hypothetical protein